MSNSVPAVAHEGTWRDRNPVPSKLQQILRAAIYEKDVAILEINAKA